MSHEERARLFKSLGGEIVTTLAIQLPETQPLLERARVNASAVAAAEKAIRDDLLTLCVSLWHFGKDLAELKELVGHGEWMFFVAANFPQLGESEKSRCNRASDAKAFFEANPDYDPNSPVPGNLPMPWNFTIESIRKCVFHLAPDKERPELPGDKPITPAAHQLTFVNHFMKFDQRIKAGLDKAPPVEILRRDLEPVIKRIAELAGRDWLESIIA